MPTTPARTGRLGPVEIRLTADVRAPAEVVWDIVVDWEHGDRWMLEGSNFRVTSDQREGVGTEIEARVRVGGITTVDAVRVSRWEPPHVLGIEHRGWVKGEALIECVPTADGCRVRWLERLEPPLGILGGAGIRAFRPLMRRLFERDLGVLKRLAERAAGTTSDAPAGGVSSPAGGVAGAGSDVGSAAAQTTATSADAPVPQPAAPNGSPPGRRRTPGRLRHAAHHGTSLFARWFWLVYLPLGVTGVLLLLVVTGVLPGVLRIPAVVVALVWGGLAVRLLVERRRRGLAVPAPRSIVLGILAVAGLGAVGALLTWVGIGRLSSSEGLAMVLVGSFFILMAVFAPMFKLVDSAFRLTARAVSRGRHAARRHAVGGRRPGTARHAAGTPEPPADAGPDHDVPSRPAPPGTPTVPSVTADARTAPPEARNATADTGAASETASAPSPHR